MNIYLCIFKSKDKHLGVCPCFLVSISITGVQTYISKKEMRGDHSRIEQSQCIKILIVNQFVHYNFLRCLADVIHRPYPCHLIFSL